VDPTEQEIERWTLVETRAGRYHVTGFGEIGPLTKEQAELEDAYEAYLEEIKAQDAAGGRTICPQCGRRTVTHTTVTTLGYRGHPGEERSDFARCMSPEKDCDWADLA
jgi:hypothetical protein